MLILIHYFVKKIQIQNANAFAAAKFGMDPSKLQNQSVTKYASVTNGTNGLLNTSSSNQLNNGSMNNVTGGGTSSNVSNLMRSFLTSSNNPNKLLANQNRSYFNHLNPSNNNSAINIFTENDQSTYSFKPSENTLNNFNSRFVHILTYNFVAKFKR